ncbi:MAG: RNA polymerase sigma factor [Phycisphaerales bacterium]|nr:RNA polymerase sigma factor [Phycisphaerales bacterium]MCI0632000.1 RNA polymerase sigma factor [Phycisphaerales bacterium]
MTRKRSPVGSRLNNVAAINVLITALGRKPPNGLRYHAAMFDLTLQPAIGLPERRKPGQQPRMASPSVSRTTKRMTSDESPSSDRDSLESMLRRASAGDQAAWRVLVDTYSARVFGLIRAQCNSADLAEEITQSTFCTIVVKIGGYTELGKFEQWLFRIAMNRLRDEMRRRKRQARPVEDEALSGLAETAAEPATAGLGQHDPAEVQALRQALTQLSDADQQIIHLRHYGELSFKQIAEILDQPLGTVLARQHRALKKLSELLGGDFHQSQP